MDHSLNCRLTIVKVEPVEVHPLHQVPQTFRLKRGQSGVTDLPEKIENYSNISHYEELPVGGCRGVDRRTWTTSDTSGEAGVTGSDDITPPPVAGSSPDIQVLL